MTSAVRSRNWLYLSRTQMNDLTCKSTASVDFHSKMTFLKCLPSTINTLSHTLVSSPTRLYRQSRLLTCILFTSFVSIILMFPFTNDILEVSISYWYCHVVASNCIFPKFLVVYRTCNSLLYYLNK